MWKLHPSYNSVVRDSWHTPIFGTKQYTLYMKLKGLKFPLKALNKHAFSRISDRANTAQEEYSAAMIMSSPHYEVLKERVRFCRSQTNFLLEAERKFLQQKLKINHLINADRGTKSHISALTKADGSILPHPRVK